LSILERNANFRTLFGIVVITIAIMLIIGTRSLTSMALSISSSQNNNKPSSHVPLLSNGGIPGNSGIRASNLNGFHNQSSSISHLYSAPPPSSSSSGGNISNGITSSNNKLIMINFDDGWKTQMIFAKPILDKYGFKASFFVVCNYVTSGDAKRLSWQDIAVLQRDGMDIESHTNTADLAVW
jgi:Polysaccharide deacetylase